MKILPFIILPNKINFCEYISYIYILDNIILGKALPVELLLNLAVDGDHLFQVLHNLLDPQLAVVDTLPRPLQVDLVAGNPGSGEGNDQSSEFLANLTEHLAPACNEMSVMLGVHGHGILHNIVQLLDSDL